MYQGQEQQDDDWDLAKIKEHIDLGKEESSYLEYKSAGALAKNQRAKDEISKDVSSFANSGGGVIIYGIKEYDETDKRHLPEKIDPVNGKEYPKEWLEQVINGNIQPKVDGLRIIPIQVSDKEKNQVIYVVEIPQSDTAHQAKTHRYYKRYNFMSSPMEDWEIKDVINRKSKTNIRLDFRKGSEFLGLIKEILWLRNNIKVDVFAINAGDKAVNILECYMQGDKTAAKAIYQVANNKEFERKFSNKGAPILSNVEMKIGSFVIHPKFITDNPILNFHVSTDDSYRCFEIGIEEIIESLQ